MTHAVFSKVNPCFQKAQVFCMDLQPAADPYNVVCRSILKYTVIRDYILVTTMMLNFSQVTEIIYLIIKSI